jgi:UDP-2-acetamido-2,6-beta-L-arabino-hexul-4-ose reductase
MNILVTGSNGFIGKNLIAQLECQPNMHVLEYDMENTLRDLDNRLAIADWVYHLAGVNRPQSKDEFRSCNVDLTAHICDQLLQDGRHVPLVFASSIQALLDNPYGTSKRQAEEVVAHYADKSGACVVIYRLRNVFGKWCRPNYNSVAATFCHCIARDQPISISDPGKELDLVYVDDVTAHFMMDIAGIESIGVKYRDVTPCYTVTLARLAELLRSFRQMRHTLLVPDLSDEFVRKLYGTYLSYLDTNDFAYDLDVKRDQRGSLAEFTKSHSFGQIFVSRTGPGIKRGNHYHHTKAEKFLVLQGEATIRLRHIRGGDVIEYNVRGEDYRVVDIPIGYTHAIENTGSGELVTLFWASEIFDQNQPDTYALSVLE